MSSLLRRYKLSKINDNVLTSDEEEICQMLLKISNCVPKGDNRVVYNTYNGLLVFEYFIKHKLLYFYLDDDEDSKCSLTPDDYSKIPSDIIISEWLEEIYNIEIVEIYVI